MKPNTNSIHMNIWTSFNRTTKSSTTIKIIYPQNKLSLLINLKNKVTNIIISKSMQLPKDQILLPIWSMSLIIKISNNLSIVLDHKLIAKCKLKAAALWLSIKANKTYLVLQMLYQKMSLLTTQINIKKYILKVNKIRVKIPLKVIKQAINRSLSKFLFKNFITDSKAISWYSIHQ